jgi:hypothetical protein
MRCVVNVPISRELCAKLDLPIERWGTIREAVVHYCTTSGYRMTPGDLLRKTAVEFAQDDEEWRPYFGPRLEFTEVCEADLPPEVMSIAKDVQGIQPLTDAQAVTFVVEVVRLFIRTSHDLDATP